MPSDDDGRVPAAARGMHVEGVRLHPVSVLLGVPLGQLLRALVLPAGALIAGTGSFDRTPLLLLVVALVGLAARLVAWRRFRFSFDGTTVRVEQGVLARSRRVVEVARIQQVELERSALHRALGVATLRIETAGSDRGPEVELRVLAIDDARALREALQPRGRSEERPEGRPEGEHPTSSGTTASPARVGAAGPTVVLRVPLRSVVLSGVTGAQLLLAPAIVPAVLQFTGDRSDEILLDVVERLRGLDVLASLSDGRVWALAVLAVTLVSVATGAVVAVVRDGGFVVLRDGDDLLVRRGLLGTRESTVPLHRVQVVRVAANPLRRALGVAALRIHSAGGSAGGSGDRRVVVPLVDVGGVEGLLADLLPSLDALPALRPHPAAARRRIVWRRLRGLALALLPFGAAAAVLLTRSPSQRDALPGPLPDLVRGVSAEPTRATALAVLAVALLALAQVALARVEHAALGNGVGRDVLAARSGLLVRTLSIAPLVRLQGTTLRASWFQARRGLATVDAHVAGPGGDVVVPDLDAHDAAVLHERLADEAAGAVTPRAVTPRAGS